MELKDFPLAWRWTDDKHVLLPQSVLACIAPQAPAIAEDLHRQSLAFNGRDGLNEDIFSIDQIDAESTDPANVTDWLLSRHANKETTVYISWDPRIAVSTTWGIFTRYWNDFCYPVSDDVNVWSAEHNWAFLYHHKEFVQFGRRQNH